MANDNEIKLEFHTIKFNIQEFEGVKILDGCYLAFYEPNDNHMEVEQTENAADTQIQVRDEKTKKNKSAFLLNDKNERIKEITINKNKAQTNIERINENKEKNIANLGLNADNINEKFDELDDNYQANIITQSERDRKNKFKDYDIFYDVYTDRENIANTINKRLGIDEKFEVKNGIAEVSKDFLDKCFKEKIWCLIPRLIPNDNNMKKFAFNPIPIKTTNFVITELCNRKSKSLTFQRRIADVEHSYHFKLQPPKVFKAMLENTEDFTLETKQKQLQNLVKSAEHKLETIKQCDELEEEVKKELIKKQNEEIEECKKALANPDKRHSKLIGDTGEYVTSLLFGKRSTRYLTNQIKMDANFNFNGMNYVIPDFLVRINDNPSIVEVKNVQTQSLTEQISFELKLAREYDLDYVFVCNNYTKLNESIAGGALTKQEHDEIAGDKEKVEAHKDATKQELQKERKKILAAKKNGEEPDWSKLTDIKTTRLRPFSEKGGDSGSRSGFISHRHLHRSIKTAFKEIYLHHTKGAAPNKIVIKRLDLNNADSLEQTFNENQILQKV